MSKHIPRKDGKLDPIEIRRLYFMYPYTDKEYSDPDPTKYTDENGNDLRFGAYFPIKSNFFVPDPETEIDLKLSGVWNKLDGFAKKMLVN
jgi:hypothetical protein